MRMRALRTFNLDGRPIYAGDVFQAADNKANELLSWGDAEPADRDLADEIAGIRDRYHKR